LLSSSFSFLRLGFSSLVLNSPTMEDKRGTKRSRSPFVEGSPSPGDVKTLSSAPSRSPSSLESPLEISSHRPRSLVFEQGGPSGKAPVIDLSSSSDEKIFIADVTHDLEFAQKVFGELNRDVLGPPSDGKVIILDDSEEEEEVREEATTNTDTAPSAAAERPSTPTASPADANEDPGATQNDSSDGVAPGPKMGKDSDVGAETSSP
jgi:hypothetical protein